MGKIFSGKTAIVTGGSFGIGQATAIAFANKGASVVVADVADGSETVNQITSYGGNALFVKCDVSKEKEVEALVAKTLETYGSIDYAFNNAGIEGHFAPLFDISEEEFDRTINVNLKGVFLCMKHQIPVMLKQGSGAIVNCASIAGLVGFPAATAYVASKHGVVGMTKTAALEFAKNNIRVNAVCPGVIKTPMIDRFIADNPGGEAQLTMGEPIGRMGKPEEIASAVIWLCSDGASFTTGQALAVDGGWVAQ
jgi:NAD(P)-dependent dehydrogenase (short-subunit alcohol dehydrogenase family)